MGARHDDETETFVSFGLWSRRFAISVEPNTGQKQAVHDSS